MTRLTLFVLRCQHLERSLQFYSALGLVFTAEQHGKGPVHYSCQLGAAVLEFYPASTPASISNVRLGFAVTDITASIQSIRLLGGRIDREPTLERPTSVVRDPDNNAVELSEEPQNLSSET